MTFKEFNEKYELTKKSFTEKELRLLAANPSTSKKILKALSEDKNSDVRSSVAYNKNTPVEILEILSKDNYWVQKVVAENPNTPPKVLREISVIGAKSYELYGPCEPYEYGVDRFLVGIIVIITIILTSILTIIIF